MCRHPTHGSSHPQPRACGSATPTSRATRSLPSEPEIRYNDGVDSRQDRWRSREQIIHV
jgi:hypothetical protein